MSKVKKHVNKVIVVITFIIIAFVFWLELPSSSHFLTDNESETDQGGLMTEEQVFNELTNEANEIIKKADEIIQGKYLSDPPPKAELPQDIQQKLEDLEARVQQLGK